VAGVGRTVGIDFAFDKIEVQPNTINAHRLLIYADRAGKQDAMADELFKAYFLEGANLTDNTTLARVAGRAGLDAPAVAAYLETDEDKAVVEQADVEARGAGIGGVPFFIFNRKVGVSGAQDPEVLLDAMLQASQGGDS
jgi:predicted DsbA family dithiol-disulfide isomerase